MEHETIRSSPGGTTGRPIAIQVPAEEWGNEALREIIQHTGILAVPFRGNAPPKQRAAEIRIPEVELPPKQAALAELVSHLRRREILHQGIHVFLGPVAERHDER